ncbi:DUF1553 domain-containing protein [Planctomycetaceae bacterium SH139]
MSGICNRLPADDAIDFNRDIRPLLSDRCFACHGPDAEHRKADFRIDDPEAATDWAIVPGDAAASEVIARITSDDADLVMPPPELNKPLTEQEIDLLNRWIDAGAEYAPHWAYVDPVWQSPPTVTNTAWVRNNLDPFILSRLEAEGLQPSPPAAPAQLVRRLAFDLTGLPPTPEMVRNFVADPSDQAYEALVDQLLSSERYGERLAVVWLDLVRYADTVGYHGDQDHSIAPYRDWVIDALNQNMPFDQFTREQLAGDLLPSPTIDQQIATGYNRLLQTSHEGGVQPKEYLAIYSADRVRNVSEVWLGGTLGCAQCHDHKYDPFSAKDFYAMAAFFADIDEARHFKEGSNALPTKRPPEIEVLRPSQRRQLAELQAQLATALEQQQTEPQIADIEQAIEEIRGTARTTMITKSVEPRPIRLLPRGNWLDDSGPLMDPQVPEFLGRDLSTDARPTRLDLANWLVDVEQGVGGLTARVMANRLWAMLMGTGISPSLGDFGGQGQPPSHPQLLDNLAVEFYRNGWDFKHLIRLIVLSQTYRQSSHCDQELRSLDPNNTLFARQHRKRLPAEMIRDNALAVGNLLVLTTGGVSARPYQPAGYYRHLNFPPRSYQADQNANQYRRGVFVHWQRQFLHPMLRAFDAPSREECTAQRAQSNTPLAALVLLNDPTFVEAARGLAWRLLSDDALTSDERRLEQAMMLAVSRTPDEFEQTTLLQSLDYHRQQFADDPERAEKLLSVGLAADTRAVETASFDKLELAAWSELARTILNLSEGIVRP